MNRTTFLPSDWFVVLLDQEQGSFPFWRVRRIPVLGIVFPTSILYWIVVVSCATPNIRERKISPYQVGYCSENPTSRSVKEKYHFHSMNNS